MKTYVKRDDATFEVPSCYAWPLKAKVIMVTDNETTRYYPGDLVYLYGDVKTREWKLAFMSKGKFDSIFEEYKALEEE